MSVRFFSSDGANVKINFGVTKRSQGVTKNAKKEIYYAKTQQKKINEKDIIYY